MPTISPATLGWWREGRNYKTQDEYLFALCDALHEEYRAIVDAGFLLQIDDSQLASEDSALFHRSIATGCSR